MIAPDATATLGFMLERAAGLVDGLVVYPERLKKNLEMSGGLYFSEAVMLALLDKGLARQGAYEIVQKSAMRAYQGEGDFRTLLGADPEISSRLTPSEVDACFDLDHALRYAERLVDRALKS
jgi:adenylosuccinate lyase